MRSVAEIGSHIKGFLVSLGRGDLFLVLLIVLVGFGSFGLGRLSKLSSERGNVVVSDISTAASTAVAAPGQGIVVTPQETTTQPTTQGNFVGSVNSDKYHYPWCPGALRIKDENKRWFATRQEAEKTGYTPAQNCKGL